MLKDRNLSYNLKCVNYSKLIKGNAQKIAFRFFSTKKVNFHRSSSEKKRIIQPENKAKTKNHRSDLAKNKISTKHKWLLILSGSVIGLLNGFFGGGGGMICVPILQKVLSLDAKKAHATAIAVIFPLSLISAFIYVINGFISSFPLLTVGLGVVAGGVIGAYALKFLPPKIIQLIFALIMLGGGIKLIL